MNNNDVFDNYLTNQYSISEKTNFSDQEQLTKLFKKNSDVLSKNFSHFFKKNISREGKILDLGCGYGNFLYYLKSLGYTNVTGLDISSEEIAICRKNFLSFSLIKSDIFEYIKNSNEKFDVIYLSHVLEHISKDKLNDLLQGFKKILNRGGFIIIVIPNCAAYFNATVSRYADITHEIGFVDKSLRQLFIVNGFENEDIVIKNYLGAVNPMVKLVRNILLVIFESFIQILGYEKQAVYTSSIVAFIRNK